MATPRDLERERLKTMREIEARRSEQFSVCEIASGWAVRWLCRIVSVHATEQEARDVAAELNLGARGYSEA